MDTNAHLGLSHSARMLRLRLDEAEAADKAGDHELARQKRIQAGYWKDDCEKMDFVLGSNEPAR